MEEEAEFNELVYLNLHPDVRAAVESGLFRSGYEHYCRYGRGESRRLSRIAQKDLHFIRDYTRLVRDLIAAHPGDYDLAMAKAIGSQTLESFVEFGDKHVHVLRRVGLQDGCAIYDLACGSGRTASALRRHGWNGSYRGADIIDELVSYARQKSPDFQFFVHRDFSIVADDGSQDIIFSWSLFTHLHLEEIYLYAEDCKRALKPGGVLVFSFLELSKPSNEAVFRSRVESMRTGAGAPHLDTFMDRQTISHMFVTMLGYTLVEFIGADEPLPGGAFGQSIAVLRK
ncbi:MAG TPA: class I SAM-dependent methyltransferase [Ramlibacter sp.]|nr:class I SAM-dependent methyltransferase [Ramlibacter sp.]